MMTQFIRRLDQVLMKRLRDEHLFQTRLEDDIRSGQVFPAIRNNRVDFYHGGGKLFSYTAAGFVTHIKYASVLTSPKNYVGEGELPRLNPIDSFASVYDRIKENCELYSGPEAQGVSEILRAFGRFVNGDAQSIIPLDIEICFDAADAEPFEADSSKKKMDRIDILFYDTSAGVLRFCEAKHFSNKEIWSTESTPPQVIRQLRKYEQQLDDRKDDILAEYKTYVRLLNQLLGTSIIEPESIDGNIPVFLLVFGFDRDQQNGRLTRLLLRDGTTIGRPSGELATEESLEVDLLQLLQRQEHLALIFCSAQNLDRLVTIYRAVKRTRKIMAIDLYTAYTLHKLRYLSSHIPQWDWPEVRVVPWGYQQQRLIDAGRSDFIEATKREHKWIGWDRMKAQKRDVVLLMRSNGKVAALESQLGDEIRKVQVIWSMWDGYWAQDQHTRPLCEKYGIERINLHTSGHASWGDLQHFVEGVRPSVVVPIHTEHADRFAQRLSNVHLLDDGEVVDV